MYEDFGTGEVKRVAQRVREGNCDVPGPLLGGVSRGAGATSSKLYRDIADEWQVYDTSGPSLILVGASSDSLIVRSLVMLTDGASAKSSWADRSILPQPPIIDTRCPRGTP